MRRVPWRRWVRTVVGPDPATVRALLLSKGEIARLEKLLAAERARHAAELAAETAQHAAELAAERERARALLEPANAAIDLLLEPATGPDCTKIRLRNKAEAEAFARRLEEDTGREPGSLEGYGCDFCPRQPALDRQQAPGRYYHVRNVRPSERSSGPKRERTAAQKRLTADAARNGRMVRQRVDPTALDRIKQSITPNP